MMHVAVVTTYVLLLIGVAVFKSRTVKSADDFIVAGRSVPVYMLVSRERDVLERLSDL